MATSPKNPRLQAALELAKAGYKVFPVPPGKKQSYVAQRSRYGSGEAWGMTNDPELLKKYWGRWPNANIGLPTGAVNGFIVIETDSPKGHAKLKADGEMSLKDAEERLGKLPDTRMAESPSTSKHRLYGHPGGRVKNSASELGPGIDVRGDGGMVVAPPSERPDGVYRWVNDLPIADLPEAWVRALVEKSEKKSQPKRALPEDANWAEEYGAEGDDERPSFEEVQSALAEILNDDLGWERWNDVGMRLYAWSSDKDGFELFDKWSRLSSKYDREATRQKWRRFHGTPPTRYNNRSLHVLAEHGFEYEGISEEVAEEDKTLKPEPEPSGNYNGAKVNGAHVDIVFKGIKIHFDEPDNILDSYRPPQLVRGQLPKLVDDFSFALAEVTGADPAGFAMGALFGAGAAIPDSYRVQPKPINNPTYHDAPRIWVALVGDVSTLKTPVTDAIRVPFEIIDNEYLQRYLRAKAKYEALDPKDKREAEEPHAQRILLDDTTFAGAQNVMRYNSDGMACIRDELSSFFATMDAFSKGLGVERPFWLKTYNGGRHPVDRGDKHRTFIIDNCGAAFLGGIQPDIIRDVDAETVNDGLIQRMLIVMLRDGVRDRDVPIPDVQHEFNELIFKLHKLPRDTTKTMINFTPEGNVVREKAFDWFLEIGAVCKKRSRKLAQHVAKYRGIYMRLCLIWHFIELGHDGENHNIDGPIAERVFKFLRDFLFQHSLSFYTSVLNVSSQEETIQSIAYYMLRHPTQKSVTSRDVMRSLGSLRGTTAREVSVVFQQMEAAGVVRMFQNKRSDSVEWVVNPLFHDTYGHRVERVNKDAEAWRKLFNTGNDTTDS